jgi:SAM-dependent methyltransferase
MGLAPAALKLIIAEHARKVLPGPVLTLGNQDVWADQASLAAWIRATGATVVDAEFVSNTSSVLASMVPERSKTFPHARTFFAMLGIPEYHDLDMFDFDSTCIRHDLNRPSPDALRDRFGLVLDGGTIEHVFDIRQSLENIVNLCRTGGRVIHITGLSGWADHGFFTFSPSLFFDFYLANGFSDPQCVLWTLDASDLFAEFPLHRYEYGKGIALPAGVNSRGMIYFSACKAEKRASVTVPIQGYYQEKNMKTSSKANDAIKGAAAYAIQIAKGYLSILTTYGIDPRGKSIIEFGPGRDFGPALILIGLGASVTLADKYLASWDDAFHSGIYRELIVAAPAEFPGLDIRPLQEAISTRSHRITGLTCISTGLEKISIPAESIDVSLSNAVFEHLYDSRLAISSLARMTRKGGWGFHQIDMRDHRDFSKPLEYLAIPDREFSRLLAKCNCECGNRLRYGEFEEFFVANGFKVERIEKNMFAEDAYLEALRPRLPARYQALELDQLKVISGRFYVRKS